jgi:uncharacterized tellurite resistance protein B-like protein
MPCNNHGGGRVEPRGMVCYRSVRPPSPAKEPGRARVATTMIERLASLFARTRDPVASEGEHVRLAAAALLCEAALMDGHLDEDEAARIAVLLAERFGLSEADAGLLLDAGRKHADGAIELYGITRTLKDAFSAEQRVQLIEMLWDVVYADGVLHDYEANLVRRVCGLIFVSDQEAGAARKRAMARLGISEGLV